MRNMLLILLAFSFFANASDTSNLKVMAKVNNEKATEALKAICETYEAKSQCEAVIEESMGVAFELGRIYGKAQAMEDLK